MIHTVVKLFEFQIFKNIFICSRVLLNMLSYITESNEVVDL